MATVNKLERLSVRDYLAGELNSPVRHELVGGQPYAMVGASNIHNLIAISLTANLRTHLSKGPCRVYMADMKVRVGDHFYYPDVAVSCVADTGPFYFITAPVLVAEVLSPSTERQDRLEKWLAYQSLDSLQEYVLIAQDQVRIDIYRRIADGWEVELCAQGDLIRLRSVDYELPVEALYEEVMDSLPRASGLPKAL